MTRKSTREKRAFSRKFSYLILFILALFIFYKAESNSIVFKRPDRVNMVFYSQNPYFLSLSNDNVNYVVNFYPDLKIRVPGGYGLYRVGALGKLVKLEKKPDIFRKAFSTATSSFVNLYFYKNKEEVFYGGENEARVELPSIPAILLSRSNATILDRIYLSLRFITLKKSDFTSLKPTSEVISGEDIFSDSDFAQEYAGFFYQKTYRNERKTVQIVYTKSRKSADLVSRILENSGIRVVDNFYNENVQKKCTVTEDGAFSQTAKGLASFFNCQLKKGETRLSDIIIVLGQQEDSWAFD